MWVYSSKNVPNKCDVLGCLRWFSQRIMMQKWSPAIFHYRKNVSYMNISRIRVTRSQRLGFLTNRYTCIHVWSCQSHLLISSSHIIISDFLLNFRSIYPVITTYNYIIAATTSLLITSSKSQSRLLTIIIYISLRVPFSAFLIPTQ